MELGRNPEEFMKVRKEIDNVIGNGQVISLENTRHLIYTGHAYCESLRIWPPIVSVNRLTDEETIIDGMKIPKNTEISVQEIILFTVEPAHLRRTRTLPKSLIN